MRFTRMELWPKEIGLRFERGSMSVLCNRWWCFDRQNGSGLCGKHEPRWLRNRNLIRLPFRLIKGLFLPAATPPVVKSEFNFEQRIPEAGTWM